MADEYHNGEFPEGEYTIDGTDPELAKNGLKYRVEMSTKNGEGSVKGVYHQNDTFTVYQVFPAVVDVGTKASIIWARVSENATGTVLYCGLKVNNHKKVILLKRGVPNQALGGVYTIEYLDPHTVRLTPKP